MSRQKRTTDGAAGNGDGDNERDIRGLCLLSLDGGGVRGLSTLYILRGLMQRLNDERHELKLKPVKPCEVFDLIGGTSTGGLIAIMLGRLEMDVEECIIAYTKLMTAVFEKKQNFFAVGLGGMIKPRFSSKGLEKAVKSVIEGLDRPSGQQITVDEPFCVRTDDEDSRKCRVFVCATAKEIGTTTLLKSYLCKGDVPGPATIWEAALATSAATGFFDRVEIGDRLYIDGAMGANNPSNEVEREAARIWCERTGRIMPLVKCFVSLGTGNRGINPMSDKAWKFLTESLAKVATDTKRTERDVAGRWREHQNTRYFRFNVDQGLQDVDLAEYKQKGLIEAATDDYLEGQDTQPRLYSCVMNLRAKKYPPNEIFIKQQAQAEEKTQEGTESMTEAEMSELMNRANVYLNKPRDTVSHRDILKAYNDFILILRVKRNQDPPASPKELTRIYNKLMSTCLRLSHFDNFNPGQRMKYIQEAEKCGKRAVENAIKSKNNDRVAQMQFYLACVKAREIQLKSTIPEFPSPTLSEKDAAREAISLSWATLGRIQNLDTSVYDVMAKESITQIG